MAKIATLKTKNEEALYPQTKASAVNLDNGTSVESEIQSIKAKTDHAKGYFATSDALISAYPMGSDGDYATVGSTDTIWVWDSDSGIWKNTGNITSGVISIKSRTQDIPLTGDVIINGSNLYSTPTVDDEGTADQKTIDGHFTALYEKTNAIESDYLTSADKDELQNKIDLKASQSEVDTIEENITTLSNGLNDAEQDIQELTNDVDGLETSKQDKLVSGTNIKTINSQSILGSGNMELSVSSKYTITISGDSGVLTTEQYNLLVDDNKNAVIRNGSEEYILVAIETNYRTYMAKNTSSDTSIEHYAITVNTASDAVNFRSWSKETISPEASSVAWGNITGTLSNQNDLQNALNGLDNKLNADVSIKQSNNNFTYNGDTVNFNQTFKNLKSGTQTTKTETISLANGTTAGLMSPSTVLAIQQMRSDIDALEGQTIRLIYTTKSNPTATEIGQFVYLQGYTEQSEWDKIGVVVKDTNHVWRYFVNTLAWTDIGIDTVNQATQSIAGIVKGAEANGKVFVEDDGTMSVNGWSVLTTLVNGKASQSDLNDLSDTVDNLGTEVDTLSTDISSLETSKQDVITDLTTIRNNANAVSTKLDKSTDTKNYAQVYYRSADGQTQSTKAVTYETIVGGGTVPIRNANNNIQVGTASDNNDATNKAYVDNGLSSKANDSAVVHKTGAETINGVKTFNDIMYLEGSTPFVMSHTGKVGLRAMDSSNQVLGQINVSNAWYDANHYGTQMNAKNISTGKYNAIRVSHNGPQYFDEDDVAHDIALEEDIPDSLSDLQDDATHRLVTDDEKTNWNGKQSAISDLTTIRSNASAGKAASDTIATYGNVVTKNTGTGNGNIPVLGSDGKLPSSVIPSIAITDTFTVNSQSAMLGLTAQVGDICIRTDENKTYILQSTPASTLANWKPLLTPVDGVTSVVAGNGLTGGTITSTGTIAIDTSVVALKSDIPAVPTTLAELTGDSTHRLVTDTEKTTWNNKSNFSGNYNDLTNKPTIPDVSGKLDKKTTSGNYVYSHNGSTQNETSITTSITSGSSALITSGAVYTGLSGKQNTISSTNKLPYSYLSGTPTIPDVSGKVDKSSFSLSGTTLTITIN